MAQTRSVPAIPAPIIIAAAVLAALLVGRLFGEGHIALALAIVLAVSYVPIVFLDLPVALAVWAALLYVDHLPVLRFGPTAIEVLLAIGWLTGLLVGRAGRLPVLSRHATMSSIVVLFVVWLGLSRVWAVDPGVKETELTYWAAPLAFAIVAMTVTTTHYVRVIAIALLAGAVVSVLIGLVGGPLAGSDASEGTLAAGRFTGGGGDPNEQAAGYVAAIFIAGGLLSVVRRQAGRVALMAAMVLVTFGFFATQSRGGLLALGVASFFALILTPRYRGRILGLIAATAAGLAVFVSSNPDALKRLTDTRDAGAGREDLWTVAWRIFVDHPVLGTGLNSFQDVSPRYVLEPGPLENVRLIAETPHLVHNTYLQLLAENGIVGLSIFVCIAIASLRACWRAARRFDEIDQFGHANLARAVMTGTIGMLAAAFFVSNVTDYRMWILFALGPVMLTIAQTTGPEPSGPRRSPRRRSREPRGSSQRLASSHDQAARTI